MHTATSAISTNKQGAYLDLGDCVVEHDHHLLGNDVGRSAVTEPGMSAKNVLKDTKQAGKLGKAV